MPSELRGALLHAARALQRTEQQAALVVGDEIVEIDVALRKPRRPAALRPAGARWAAAPRASIHSPRESATARSMTFSSSRTLPGQACARRHAIASSETPAHRPCRARARTSRRSDGRAAGCPRSARAAAAARSGSRSGGSRDPRGSAPRRPRPRGGGWSRRRCARRRGGRRCRRRAGSSSPGARAAASPGAAAAARRSRRGRACRRRPSRRGRPCCRPRR